jgi:hypothetical protein
VTILPDKRKKVNQKSHPLGGISEEKCIFTTLAAKGSCQLSRLSSAKTGETLFRSAP